MLFGAWKELLLLTQCNTAELVPFVSSIHCTSAGATGQLLDEDARDNIIVLINSNLSTLNKVISSVTRLLPQQQQQSRGALAICSAHAMIEKYSTQCDILS